MIEMSESIKNISAAILRFQGAVSGVHKDGTNPHFKSRYATLENVIDTARPALQEAGIMFTQSPGAIVDGSLELTTLLIHAESGEWMRGTMQMPLARRDPQGTGSAQTYSMRYSLMAMLGLPPTDDDGESAVERFQTPNTVTGPAIRSSAALKRDNVWPEFDRELAECNTVRSVQKLALAWSAKAEKENWNATWRDTARDKLNDRKDEILNGVPDDDTFPGDLPSKLSPLQSG